MNDIDNIIINSALFDRDYIIKFLSANLNMDKKYINNLENNIPPLSDSDNNFLNIISEKLDKIIFDETSIPQNEANIKDFRLKSIFTFFRHNDTNFRRNDTNNNNEYYYPLNITNKNNNSIIYPIKSELNDNIDLETIEKDLNDININNMNSIINIIRNISSNIPYYSKGKLSQDISVYDSLKIRTALVSALLRLNESRLNDKSDENIINHLNNDNEKYFALLSGDISGIQKFIYTISSKGALKSLRARSFYLEIMLEHIVDEILEKFSLYRFNLLYTGGGHFYIILPKLPDLKEIIEEIKYKINDWFIKEFSIELYMAMDFEEFSFNDLKNTKNIFNSLPQKLSKDKQKRYNIEQLKNILIPHDNKSDFECSICHTSSKNTKERADLGYACDICYNLYKAGKFLLNEEDIYIINNKDNLDKDAIVELPSICEDNKRYLYFGDIDNNNAIIRTYSKNDSKYENINLYIGNYNYNFRNEPDLISFEELLEGTKGINRIGVLRCDVDNLGQAFISGFGEYSNIFRTSSLSRHLSLFFKHYINFICNGDIGFDNFNLYNYNKIYFNKEKRIVIVYSGGDDVFLVGYWLDVINFSFDLRNAFGKYTNNKLTFSAGIGFFHHKYPISKMAGQTGELEELAKENKYGIIDIIEKDSIALFGIPNNSNRKNNKFEYCFNWEEFENVTEKINKIFSLCYFDDDSENNASEKNDNENDKINLVRLAYALGRIKSTGSEEYVKNYNEFKNSLYNWIFDENERKYLIIALDLIIYLFRDDS